MIAEEYIKAGLKQVNKDEKANRVQSERRPDGLRKLSPTWLNKPTLWTLLHLVGVQDAEAEEYSLGVFRRGKDVEDTYVELVKMFEPTLETQNQISYRGMTGYIDIHIPDKKEVREVKSIKTTAWNYIKPSKKAMGEYGTADIHDYIYMKYPHYVIQAATYALDKGYDTFTIDLIKADDLQSLTLVYNTADYKQVVDSKIDAIEEVIKSYLADGTLPEFVPFNQWDEHPTYASYKHILFDAAGKKREPEEIIKQAQYEIKMFAKTD